MSRRSRDPEPWDAVPTVGRTPFERSARFWLNAYPRRWREMHGDELVGVLEDVARTDSGTLPRRLPRAEVLALLRAGWALRWREHPPFWRWLGYRVLGRRLPARYWWWVADDIRSPWYPVIEGAGRLAGMAFGGFVGGFVGARIVTESLSDAPLTRISVWAWLAFVVVWAAGVYLARNSWRRYGWLKHVVEGNVPESMRSAWSGESPTRTAG